MMKDIGQDLRTEIIGMLGQLWRRRWLIVATAWVVCAAGWSVTLAWPDRYESRARIYVDTETLLSPLLHGMSVVPNVNKQAAVMQRTLLTRQNLEAVLTDLRPELSPADTQAWEAAVKALESATSVEQEGGRESRLFLLSHLDPDPRRAKEVVERLLAIFINRSTEASRTDIAQAKEFIDIQLGHYEGLLREAEARLAAFKRRNLGLLPQSGNFAQSVETARGRLIEITAALDDAKARRQALREELGRTPQYLSVDSAPQVIINGSSLSGPESRLAELEAKLGELRLHYTDRHPDVIATLRLIEELTARLDGGGGGVTAAAPASRRQQVPNPLHEQIRLKMVDLEAEIQMLTRRHADQKTEVERLGGLAATAPAVEAEFTALNRDYNVLKANYEELLERRQSAKISEDMQERVQKVQFSIVETPQVPAYPAVPNRPVLLTFVLLGSLACGAVIVLVLYQLHRPLVTVQQLREVFTVPVIGTISQAEPAAGAPRHGGLALAIASGGLVACYVAIMVWVQVGTIVESSGRVL